MFTEITKQPTEADRAWREAYAENHKKERAFLRWWMAKKRKSR